MPCALLLGVAATTRSSTTVWKPAKPQYCLAAARITRWWPTTSFPRASRTTARTTPCGIIQNSSTDVAAPSPVHLSLRPAHRRGWGSFYAALARGRIDAEVLRNLLARHPLPGSGATPVYAVDMSAWPRCDAEYSPLLKDTITILLVTRPAYRGRMGLPVHCTAQLRPRELDRPRGRRARPALPGRQRGRRRAGEGLAGPARKSTVRSSVRLRRLLYDPV